MALSLAEKALLLLHVMAPQEPGQPFGSSVEASDAERITYGIVISALQIDALLQRRLGLKRAALFVRCRPCYLVLVFALLFLAMALLLGPAIASAAGLLSMLAAVALSIGLFLLWGVVFLISAYLISGRLSIEETTSQDEALALVLRRMRETGQGKTCQSYSRRLACSHELQEQAAKMYTRLLEHGYIVAKEAAASFARMPRVRYVMNPDQPECQQLQDQFRAFLLSGASWDEHIAALAILLSPRVIAKNSRRWPQPRWYAWFAPEELPRVRARLTAIKAQRDQAIQAHLGVTTYQALLTIRNQIAG